LLIGLVLLGCNEEPNPIYDDVNIFPTVYENGKFRIYWSKYDGPDFTNYQLYVSSNENMSEKQLLASFEDPDSVTYIENQTSLELNEKKYYQIYLSSILESDSHSSNITSSHNWYIYNDILNCNKIDYTINTLDNDAHPYYRLPPFTIEEIEELYPVDSLGIPVYSKDGTNYNHPVRLAQIVLHLMNSYSFDTENHHLLDRAKLLLDRLLEIAYSTENLIFFPYPFDFSLHSDDNELMVAPWYSGMAQGQALSAFLKYYSASEDNLYLQSAEKIFNSYFKLMQNGSPWISGIDGENYLWFEEYPDSGQPNKTLNGMIFAIYGLYDYYQETLDQQCLDLLKISITTIQKYIEYFRVEGEQSYYCLTHQVQNPTYHRIHKRQLGYLYAITGEQYFYDMQQLMEADYND